MTEERDEYGIPAGDHTATCGCRFTGRALLDPCDEHRPVVEAATSGAISVRVDTPAVPPPGPWFNLLPPMADKMATRPQDWAPPARAHLFGMNTLNDEEHAYEMRRRSAYPDRYPRST